MESTVGERVEEERGRVGKAETKETSRTMPIKRSPSKSVEGQRVTRGIEERRKNVEKTCLEGTSEGEDSSGSEARPIPRKKREVSESERFSWGKLRKAMEMYLYEERSSSGDDERTNEEEEKVYKRRREKVKSPKESKERGEGQEGTECLAVSVREEMERSLQNVRARGEHVWKEVAAVWEKWKEWEEEWKIEKEKVWRKLEELERAQKQSERERREEREKVEKVEKKRKELESRKGVGREKEEGKDRRKERMDGIRREEKREVEERGRGSERRLEKEEREKKSRNVVIRGLEVGSDGGRNEVEKLMKAIGARVQVDEVKGEGGREGGKPRILVVKLRSEEEKREVMVKKRGLRGRKEKIGEDLSWNERRRNWILEQRAWEERRKGNEVRMGRDKIWVNGRTWSWDESTGVIREEEEDGRRKEENGKDDKGGKEDLGERRGGNGENNREGKEETNGEVHIWAWRGRDRMVRNGNWEGGEERAGYNWRICECMDEREGRRGMGGRTLRE